MDEVNTFTAPIAGQSLTTEPKGYAWERPPEMNEVSEVMNFYITRLGDQSVMDDVFTALDNGFPLSTMVDSILGVGVMEGMHTVDASLIVSPVLHEYILAAAQVEDVNVKEHPVKKQDSDNKNNEEAFKAILRKSVDEAKDKDGGTDLLEDIMETMGEKPSPDDEAAMASGVEMVTDDQEKDLAMEREMEDMPMEEPPKGLMARRT